MSENRHQRIRVDANEYNQRREKIAEHRTRYTDRTLSGAITQFRTDVIAPENGLDILRIKILRRGHHSWKPNR